jgi:lipopolysaccharide/colanic/teichoic acid biosynthesis glycosyltransferase
VYKNFLKPGFDFLIALLLFVLLLPVFLIITFFLFLNTQKNPFFLQKRPGKNEKIFTIIKFKTMDEKRDREGNLLPDSQRLTAVGKFVRSVSLDEIPQLLNVIKGDMSLVGPRPLLPEYLPLYSDFQRQRHLVKPGITGWAQVNGRNTISWEQKFQYDLWYVAHQSFFLDIKILYKTILKVIKRDNINTEKDVTMSKFKGN